MQPLIVTCPCCSAELDIDVRTGKVLRTGTKEQREADAIERFDGIAESVKTNANVGTDAFDSLQQELRGRESTLDSAFADAFQKVKETDDGSRPLNPLDFD